MSSIERPPMTKGEFELAEELKTVKAELAQLRQNYAALVDNAPDVLARFDRQGRFLYINQTAERNTGIPASVFIGKTFRELGGLPEENIIQWEQALALVLETHESTRIEYEFPVPDRGVGFFECILTPDLDAHGEVDTIVTVTRDLTERHATDVLLRQNEDRYRSLVDATSQIVWTNNAEGEMCGPNADWGAFTGQTEQEYQGFGWSRAVHPDDAQTTIDAWTQCVTARRVFIFEHRLRRHDGVYRLFAIRAVPVLESDGCIREWVGIHTDVTERREQETIQRESDARKEAMLTAALDCIITIDSDERVIEWNPAAEKTFGFSHAAALGHPLSELIIPPQFRMAHARGIAHYLATGEGPVLNRRVEVTAIRSDGTEFPAELTAVPIQLEGRTLFTAYLRDVTEREHAASQQRAFLRDVLLSVTEGRLHLCSTASELPKMLNPKGETIMLLISGGMRDLRRQADDVAESLGFAVERRHDLVTAVSEVAMNSIVHAGGGVGRVFSSQDTIQVRIEDHGKGIDVANLPRATLEKGYTTAGTLGHGMKMMLSTADRVWLLTGPSGTTVVLEQDRIPPRPDWL